MGITQRQFHVRNLPDVSECYNDEADRVEASTGDGSEKSESYKPI